MNVNVTIDIKIAKSDSSRRIVYGPVLIPDRKDLQGHIVPMEEVEKAAHLFLSKYNSETKLGLWHSTFPEGLKLVESYIVPEGCVVKIGDMEYGHGTWIMAVKVIDDAIWTEVESGKYNGFSVHGKATETKDPSEDK